jgi:tetratricopeptide (TPR) repeat protein
MAKPRNEKSSAQPLRCPNCGAARDRSDAFCRKCGNRFDGEAKPNGKMRGLKGLRAFGLAVLAFALVFALLEYGRGGFDGGSPPVQPISITDVGLGTDAGPRGQPATQPLTARGTADALFNQAMSAHESGDSAGARQFVPMAITAYRDLIDLDLDARYHLALLSLAAGRPEDALAQADTTLAEVPDHLLALSVAARAHAERGETAAAADYYRRFLDAYTPDLAASRPEYIDHGRALPARRDEARRYLQERGLLRQ